MIWEILRRKGSPQQRHGPRTADDPSCGDSPDSVNPMHPVPEAVWQFVTVRGIVPVTDERNSAREAAFGVFTSLALFLAVVWTPLVSALIVSREQMAT